MSARRGLTGPSNHGRGWPAACQALMASTGCSSMMMFSIRLSRTHKAQPTSMVMTATILTQGRTRDANRNPSDIIPMSLSEFITLSPPKCRVPGNAERGQPNRPYLKGFVWFSFFDSAFSEALQKRQKLVTGPVAALPAFERISFRQGLLFEREVRMEINLRRLHGFMAQP